MLNEVLSRKKSHECYFCVTAKFLPVHWISCLHNIVLLSACAFSSLLFLTSAFYSSLKRGSYLTNIPTSRGRNFEDCPKMEQATDQSILIGLSTRTEHKISKDS